MGRIQSAPAGTCGFSRAGPGRVIGLDVAEAGAANPHLDEFRRLEDRCWPLPDSSAGLVLADNVVEHLPEPENFFAKAAAGAEKRRYAVHPHPEFLELCRPDRPADPEPLARRGPRRKQRSAARGPMSSQLITAATVSRLSGG